MQAEFRAKELGLELEAHPLPIGPLVAVVIDGHRAWVSGQPPSKNGVILYSGQVGIDGISVEQGYEAARLCMLNCLAALRLELGSLDRIERIIKVVGFVQSSSGFSKQSQVINGASELLIDLFGAVSGRHARSAIGVASLPGNMAVEVEMVVAIRHSDDIGSVNL